MSLKTELEGINGFIGILKDKFLPLPKEMAKKALEKYEEENGVLTNQYIIDNFSNVLSSLIQTEYKLFIEFEKKILIESVREFFLDSSLNAKYPSVADVLNSAKNIVGGNDSDIEKISKINGEISDYNKIISFSMIQSAKTRAGQSLENHIEVLFSKLGFRFDTQKSLTAGEVLDFIFPNIGIAISDPHSSMVCECQTTLKDRFRLSLGKIPRGSPIKKYILTASGKGLITSRDIGDLTSNKVSEIKDKGWKLVVFKEVKDNSFTDEPSVISYEDLVKRHYPSIASLW